MISRNFRGIYTPLKPTPPPPFPCSTGSFKHILISQFGFKFQVLPVHVSNSDYTDNVKLANDYSISLGQITNKCYNEVIHVCSITGMRKTLPNRIPLTDPLTICVCFCPIPLQTNCVMSMFSLNKIMLLLS